MTSFRAWHLPRTEVREAHPIAESSTGSVFAPALSPRDVADAARAAREAGQVLRARSTSEIVGLIDHVARRFLDPDDPIRTEALRWLPEVTGYSPAMCTRVLDRMAADWTDPALRRLLRAELGNPRVLDDFVPHARGQRVRAIPPDLVLHVLSGNVPGVGVTSIVRSLLVRAPAICKTAAGEPVLPVLFARALAAGDPDVGRALAVTYWRGGDVEREEAALGEADLVVHYGGQEAITDLRRRLPPHVRLVDHGPRVSFAAVAREHAPRSASSRAAALAVALFDQQGCVSPHLVYVEGGPAEAEDYAGRLARSLARLARELPRGRLSTEEAGVIQQLRGTMEFRGIAGQNVRLWAGPDLAYTVIFDADPAFAAACLNRTVWVKPVPDLDALPHLLRGYPHLLQTAAIDAPRARRHALATPLALAGVTRVTTLAAMPWPRSSWHHDGRGPLRELLRFCDLDGSS